MINTWELPTTNSVWTLCGQVLDDEPVRVVPIHVSPFKIGRRSDLSMSVQCPTVSNVHAELIVEKNELAVRDLGSTNGTYVNGARINELHPLCEGDILQLASLVFRIATEERSESNKTLPGDDCERAMALIRLDRLLSERAVVPFFQPIVHTETGHIAGYELLGRSKVYGLQTPQTMFYAASQLNLEIELSRLFRSVGLEASPGLPTSNHIFMNSHPSEVNDPDGLIDSLRELRGEHPERDIILEIHECTITDPKMMLCLRQVLKELNIGLAYDDFGAGQSRLVELSEVPPDFLKFDIGMIKNIDHASSGRHRILQSLVNMARDLNITPLAEGVETPGEAAVCGELGFALCQGFYFGYPSPVGTVPC